MKDRIIREWSKLTIKQKISAFIGGLFLVVFLSISFDMLLAKTSLIDFNTILDENVKSVQLIKALETENEVFRQYIKEPSEENTEKLNKVAQNTKWMLDEINVEYSEEYEDRYVKIWAIKNAYEVYEVKRDAFLRQGERDVDYIKSLYAIYDIQDYILKYANEFMGETLADGSGAYERKLPRLIGLPIVLSLVNILLLIGMIKFAKLMNRSILVPVTKLAQAASKASGNMFDVPDVEVYNQDEIGKLVLMFNHMKDVARENILFAEEKRLAQIKLHEEALEKIEVEKRLESMKLELLKSQINPHFLFNTLNVIAGMANLEEAATTEKMITALSGLFRYNLKTHEVEVQLARELKVAEDYMYLQQMRFGSRISYETDIRVDENVLVPAFMLQPLVENAILHGAACKEDSTRIKVRIWENEEYLKIAVIDSGAGIEREELKALRKRVVMDDYKHNGIGVGNIYKRIMSMYEGSTFNIYSIYRKGTLVKICIPKNPGRQ